MKVKACEPLRRVEVEVVQQTRSLLDTMELEREVDLWLRGREYLSPGTVIKVCLAQPVLGFVGRDWLYFAELLSTC